MTAHSWPSTGPGLLMISIGTASFPMSWRRPPQRHPLAQCRGYDVEGHLRGEREEEDRRVGPRRLMDAGNCEDECRANGVQALRYAQQAIRVGVPANDVGQRRHEEAERDEG